MATDERDLVWREIGRIGTCMMATFDGREIRARPMVGMTDREENRLWFVARRSEQHERGLRDGQRVCLAYADIAAQVFVALSGRVELVEDRERLHRFWTHPLDAWFDGGPDDPDALLIAVTPEMADVWDEPNADIVRALEVLTASSGDGVPPIGGNRRVRMTHRT